jgi:pimeloyl-ACP methyl ester carboxylesterase
VLPFLSHEAPHGVVFIHGAGGNSLLWRRTLQGLSGTSKAYAVDLPGHPSGEITCRTVEDYSEAVYSFIREQALVRPVVCGHSMGGAIALTLALSRGKAGGGP